MDVHQDHETIIDSAHTMEYQVSDQVAHQQPVNDKMMTAQLPIELTNATGTRLDDLNDDCLLEIFSKKSLTLMDLCSLAETCQLFKGITQRVFPKNLVLRKKNDDNSSDDYEYVAERMFKNFGSCLVGVPISDDLGLVAKHCVAGNLKKLRIFYVEITDVAVVELKPIFQQLQLLSMSELLIKCDANVFANCCSLTDLRIENVYNFNGILENHFPQLRRFKFCHEIQVATLNIGRLLLNFCERHQTLKRIRLTTDGCDPVDDFVQKLGNICKELEELDIGELYASHGRMIKFSNFQNLKRLVLRYFPFGVQLQNLKSLEALKIIGDFDRKALLEALPLLQNLREFFLYRCLGPGNIPWASLSHLTKLRLSSYRRAIDNVVDVIRQLPNLVELDVGTRNVMLSEKEFVEIVEVVKGRPNILSLKCNFEFSREYLSKIRNNENLKVKLLAQQIRNK